MIRFGIVGTSKISDKFVGAIKNNKDSIVGGVYSRTEEKAKEFMKKNTIEGKIYTDLEEMIKSQEIDAIYIASPHSLHGEQTYLCLKNKKPVLCEKPITTDLEMFDTNVKFAQKNQITYMEAMRTTLLPNFKIIEENLHKIGPVRFANLNYSQYSSRYDELKNGVLTNMFDPKFYGGSAFDIGIYPLYVALKMFGIPNSYTGKNVILSSGVEGAGNITLNYGDKVVQVAHSKITESVVPNEILGEKGSIIIDRISTMGKVEIVLRNGEKEEISVKHKENDMEYELEEFISLVKNKKVESEINTYEISRKSVEILSKIRTKV